tara:strand:- start:49 stop:744 length:696 start_codon:yes stop_codon:yes gene_type:complete
MKNICIIPARKGSKRIKNKNIRLINNKPLIYYPIKLALDSNIFDKVLVTTDSKKIQNLATKYGAISPFLRPKYLSNDFALTRDVIKHAYNYFKNKFYTPDNICWIYPTSILLESKDLIKSYNKLINKKKNLKIVFSVTNYSYPVLRSLKIKDDKIKMFFPKFRKYRSQDLEIIYHDAGLFYWGNNKIIENNINTFSKYASPYYIPNYKAQDIDNLEDLEIAKLKFKNLFKK